MQPFAVQSLDHTGDWNLHTYDVVQFIRGIETRKRKERRVLSIVAVRRRKRWGSSPLSSIIRLAGRRCRSWNFSLDWLLTWDFPIDWRHIYLRLSGDASRKAGRTGFWAASWSCVRLKRRSGGLQEIEKFTRRAFKVWWWILGCYQRCCYWASLLCCWCYLFCCRHCLPRHLLLCCSLSSSYSCSCS